MPVCSSAAYRSTSEPLACWMTQTRMSLRSAAAFSRASRGADRRLRVAVVQDHQGRPPIGRHRVLEGIGERVAGSGRLQHRDQLVGVGGQGGPAAGGAQRLGDPAAGARGQHRAAPDQRLRLGQSGGQVLGRVLRDVGVRRAVRGDLVHGVGHPPRVDLGPSCIRCSAASETMAAASGSAVAVGSRMVELEPAWSAMVEAGGQAISSWAPRRTASCTVATSAGELDSLAITTTRSRAPTQPGRPYAGQATNGHRADRLQHRPDEPGLAAGRDHRARSVQLADLQQGLLGLADLTAQPRAGLGQPAQPGVGTAQRLLVFQPGVVEHRSGTLVAVCGRGPGRRRRTPSRWSAPRGRHSEPPTAVDLPRDPARGGRRRLGGLADAADEAEPSR